ncbi:uncharacterized protein N7506_005594 [Penicillium brevicompactum]|uniref:uncharacterized protein n=1 Tax=Penicillium brevicompactum TaxID=5074 RepID=UPI002541C6CC|nr:uncharacterized protein N7506_005594 [Penicillium brevicompactum]KAJ5335658.1 hypothetical protein N7506_005594 [Penicillium brevicompactum]
MCPKRILDPMVFQQVMARNPGGTFYNLSLANGFNVGTSNLSGLFTKVPDPTAGYANFEGGAMFGNDREIILYGGLTRPTDSEGVPRASEALGYRYWHTSLDRDEESFFNSTLPSTITRHVTDGGKTSAPSEDLAFYFGGMRGRDWGPITSDDGYLQNTTGDIPSGGRASFCSTLASASDGSSHNIYIYGGYNGQDPTADFYDDVYILSLPFSCGSKPTPGGLAMVVLSDLEFQKTYAPNAIEEYLVPSMVARQIGGTAKGNANRAAPASRGDPRLKSLFGAPYTKTITTWYPYATSAKPLHPKTTASQGSTSQGDG